MLNVSTRVGRRRQGEPGDGLPAAPPGFWSSPTPQVGAAALAGTGPALPPRRTAEVFRADLLPTLSRLALLLAVVLRYFLAVMRDKLAGRDAPQRRAKRLRALLEASGATYVKLGQQLSVRIDLLPYEFATELEGMLDAIPAFPLAEAIERVERAAGRPLAEVFQCIDPVPIGSASIACVYRAVLRDGAPVALKVRRPGIGKLFAADLRALGWLTRPVEALFYPRGFFRDFLRELQSMLLEELDFRKEARYTDLFRRGARKDKLRFVRAPRVHWQLSNHEVLVLELISGLPLAEVVRAAETRDEPTLAALAEQGIEPKKIARRLLRVSRYGAMEGVFFHADLHPANIFVHPGSRLTLIDFGSCGAITERERHLWRRIVYAQARGDVGAMVQAVLATIEPLPYVDVDTLAREIEMVFWQDLLASRSAHAQWWERTTANLWISFFAITGKYKMPMHLNTLRMVRVTLLADSLAARLHPKIRTFDEYRRFDTAAGRRAKKRLRKSLAKLHGDAAFIGYEQLYEAGVAAFYSLRRLLDRRPDHHAQQVPTRSFLLALLIRTVLWMAFVSALLLAGLAAREAFSGPGAPLPAVLWRRVGTVAGWRSLWTRSWYPALLALCALPALRQLLLRLDQKR